MNPNKFIQIDEEGYLMSSGIRVADESYAQRLMSELKVENRGCVIPWSGDKILVEAFDQPLVIRHVEQKKERSGADSATFHALGPYGFEIEFSVNSLRLDEWDRFHGTTSTGLPFVFGRQAQMEFFDLCDEFDDESVTVSGRQYVVQPLLPDTAHADKKEFWDEKHKCSPKFDLGGPHPALASVLPQLKLNRARIAVLGGGAAHDAAFLAEQGHFVTMFDVSPVAIEKAKALYGSVERLTLVEADVFKMPTKFLGQFDIVFEHTFYCAVNPVRRNELIQLWRKLLADDGHLLALFFLLDYTDGPPFGTTEWESRQRLRRSFNPLYWTRWQHSPAGREGLELLVYAQKTLSSNC